MINFLLRIIMVILLLMALGGCTVNEEKTIFQMARTKQEEIVKIRVAHAGRTIELSDDKAVAQILQPMATAVPALDAGNTRIGSLNGGDYVIDAFSSLGIKPYTGVSCMVLKIFLPIICLQLICQISLV